MTSILPCSRVGLVLLAVAALLGCGGELIASSGEGGGSSEGDGSALDGGSSSHVDARSEEDHSSTSTDGAAPDTTPCVSELTLCDGKCVDEQTDQNNCGGCGLTDRKSTRL